MRAPLLAAVVVLALAPPLTVAPAGAAILDTGCALYREEALSGGVPTQMLQDTARSAECLVSILADLDGAFSGTDIDPRNLELLTQVTGALLRLFDLAEAGGKGATNSAIEVARQFDNTRSASVLSFGAGLDERQARMNSSLVFANLVDNSTLCVALDHLAHPRLTDNGRVNLLGIVSLVAPYSVRENHDAIARVADYFAEVSTGNDAMTKTLSTVNNLKRRLDASPQEAATAGELAECRSYTMQWATGTPYALSYSGDAPVPPAQP
jgi:hypothetical protein